ncbi:MAG: universal stress protein [Gammaproteobacteria bacterium]|nr:universal stress protein [Gammaproteobacteria bacterium]
MYKHILLAVELNTKGDKEPIEKAMELAKKTGAQISILHAIEHISSYGAAYGVAVGADIEEMLLENATKEMRKLGKELKVPEELQIIKFGPAKVVILEEAERLKVDMIVVGSHGRHGIRLLLGSTANAVLHAATCDVLAVRLKH